MTTSAQYLTDLDATIERLDRIAAWWRANVDYDPIEVLTRPQPGPGSAVAGRWCDEHEQPLSACHRAERMCEGLDVSQWIRRDGTGEAALAAEHMTRQLWRYLRSVTTATATLEAYVHTHQPVVPMTAAERDAIRRANTLGCESCARARDEQGAPRHCDPVGGPTDVGGLLTSPHLLCRMCKDRTQWRAARDLPPYPTEGEVSDRWNRWNGVRWPRIHADA